MRADISSTKSKPYCDDESNQQSECIQRILFQIPFHCFEESTQRVYKTMVCTIDRYCLLHDHPNHFNTNINDVYID